MWHFITFSSQVTYSCHVWFLIYKRFEMIPNRTFQWTHDQSWKYRAEIEVIVNKWLIVSLIMGHSRDQALDESVSSQTLNGCSCDPNWSQNNDPEEQIRELWSSNSMRENDIQVNQNFLFDYMSMYDKLQL